MKRKQFLKGIQQLSQEGAIQTFKENNIGVEELIVGVVGMLQLEVLAHRLKHEYGVELRVTNLPFRYVRWILNEGIDPASIKLSSSCRLGVRQQGSPGDPF